MKTFFPSRNILRILCLKELHYKRDKLKPEVKLSEFITLYEFDDRWLATQILINRAPSDGNITFSVTFTKDDEIKTLMFTHPDDPDAIIEFIDVERVIISKEINSQREYGTIRMEFIGEACSEVWCDSVALKEN